MQFVSVIVSVNYFPCTQQKSLSLFKEFLYKMHKSISCANAYFTIFNFAYDNITMINSKCIKFVTPNLIVVVNEMDRINCSAASTAAAANIRQKKIIILTVYTTRFTTWQAPNMWP